MSIFDKTYSFTLDSFNDNSLISYGLFKNGVFIKKQYPVGTFIHKHSSFDLNIGNASTTCKDQFILNLPKMPGEIFYSLIKFFRQVAETIKSEVYASIYFNKEIKDYFIYVPTQQVSGSSVKFTNDSEMLNNSNLILVADFHSHCYFNAFISTTDYNDETASRLFGIIGNLDKDEVSYVFRAATNKHEISVELEDCFDFESKDFDTLFDSTQYDVNYEEVKNKITPYVIPTPKVASNNSKAKTVGLDLDDFLLDFNTPGNPLYYKPIDVLFYDLKEIEKHKKLTSKNVEDLTESLTAFIKQYHNKEVKIVIDSNI